MQAIDLYVAAMLANPNRQDGHYLTAEYAKDLCKIVCAEVGHDGLGVVTVNDLNVVVVSPCIRCGEVSK